MYEDNTVCIKMIENPVVSRQNKVIEPDCHFVRDHHRRDNIRVQKVNTTNQITDTLTKKPFEYMDRPFQSIEIRCWIMSAHGGLLEICTDIRYV